MAKNNIKKQSSPKAEDTFMEREEAIVILVASQYIIVNKNGNAIRINGVFNYKKGDIIEI